MVRTASSSSISVNSSRSFASSVCVCRWSFSLCRYEMLLPSIGTLTHTITYTNMGKITKLCGQRTPHALQAPVKSSTQQKRKHPYTQKHKRTQRVCIHVHAFQCTQRKNCEATDSWRFFYIHIQTWHTDKSTASNSSSSASASVIQMAQSNEHIIVAATSAYNNELCNKMSTVEENCNPGKPLVSASNNSTNSKAMRCETSPVLHQNGHTAKVSRVFDTAVNRVAAMHSAKRSGIENGNHGHGADDAIEDLAYGPGIVSKLRCRYLSLALRAAVKKQRPSLDNLRRASSLNSLLEAEDVVDDGADHETLLASDNGATAAATAADQMRNTRNNTGDDASSQQQHPWRTHENNGYTGSGSVNNRNGMENGDLCNGAAQRRQYDRQNNNNGGCGYNRRYARQTVRGNDSMKRARSVDALMNHDDDRSWHRGDTDVDFPSSNLVSLHELAPTSVRSPPNVTDVSKRPTSWIEDSERPPVDFVKQIALKFESVSSKIVRLPARHTNGDVAAKIASYKNLIGQEKKSPVATVVQPNLSRKPAVKPRIGNRSGVYNEPNMDVSTVRNHLERNANGAVYGNYRHSCPVGTPSPIIQHSLNSTFAKAEQSPLSTMDTPKLAVDGLASSMMVFGLYLEYDCHIRSQRK